MPERCAATLPLWGRSCSSPRSYLYISISIYIYLYLYISISLYIYISISLYLYISISRYLSLSLSIYKYIYIYIYICIYVYCMYKHVEYGVLWAPNYDNATSSKLTIGKHEDIATVSFHNFKSQNVKLSVSNPNNTYVAYVSVLPQISNCQGIGRKNKHEILKTDRSFVGHAIYTRARVGKHETKGSFVGRPPRAALYGRFPKCHPVFLGRDPGTLKSDIVSTKTYTINLFGSETLKLKIRRLKLWKPTVGRPPIRTQRTRMQPSACEVRPLQVRLRTTADAVRLTTAILAIFYPPLK